MLAGLAFPLAFLLSVIRPCSGGYCLKMKKQLKQSRIQSAAWSRASTTDPQIHEWKLKFILINRWKVGIACYAAIGSDSWPIHFQWLSSSLWVKCQSHPSDLKESSYSGPFYISDFIFNYLPPFLLCSRYARLSVFPLTCQTCFSVRTLCLLFLLPGTLSPNSCLAHLLISLRSVRNSSPGRLIWPSDFWF